MVNRNRYVGFCSHSLQQEHLPLNIEQIPVLTAHPSCVKKGWSFTPLYTQILLLGANPVLLVGTSVPFISYNQLIKPCEDIPLYLRSWNRSPPSQSIFFYSIYLRNHSQSKKAYNLHLATLRRPNYLLLMRVTLGGKGGLNVVLLSLRS